MNDDAIVESFESFIESDRFPCVGAKAALVRDRLTIVVAESIESPRDDLRIYTALREFGSNLDRETAVVQSFVVLFRQPVEQDEHQFEKALWHRLQSLHNLDVVSGEAWHPGVADDPNSAHFSMSIGSNAYFVVGLHPGASRPARCFERPVMVFNSHQQFETLREDGRYKKMQSIIRERDAALAGHINPMLDDYGERSEARQYSGRRVEEDWECPFETQELLASD